MVIRVKIPSIYFLFTESKQKPQTFKTVYFLQENALSQSSIIEPERLYKTPCQQEPVEITNTLREKQKHHEYLY